MWRPFSHPPLFQFYARLETRRARRYYYVMRSKKQSSTRDAAGAYSDPPFLVLASLATGPKHGHAMIEDIQQMSGSRLGPGTLYGAIARLEGQGWIEALPMDGRRRPYRMTSAGRAAFEAKVSALRRFVSAGEQRLGLA